MAVAYRVLWSSGKGGKGGRDGWWKGGGGKVGGGSVENLQFGVCRLYNSFSLQRAEVQILAIICISVAN